MNPLGVILAGGGAVRMGRDKALVEVAGRPMVEWVIAALRAATTDLVVVGREGTLAGTACVPDDRPARRGPLAGLATALRLAGTRPVLLAAVDQPWIRYETLQALLELAGPIHAVVPVDAESRQVTCAVYPGSWAQRAASEEAAGRSIQSLLDELPFRSVEGPEWQEWGEDGRSWFSVDDETSLEDGVNRYGSPA